MGSIYRSELMTRCQIFLQTDSAYCCIAELGELGLAQFIDLNEDVNSFQKKYINEVRRCEEMERKLRFVEEEVENDGIAIVDSEEHVPAPLPKDMNELEANFEKLEEQLLGINTNLKALKDSYIKQVERRAVLEKVKLLLGEGNRSAAAQSISEAVRGEAGPIITVQANGVNGYANGPSKGGDLASVLEDKKDRENTELRFIAGVIKRDRVPTFERLLWRLARGKVYVRALDMDEDEDSDLSDGVEKAVFILFFSGEQLRSKVKKACDGFRAHIYECPDNAVERAMQATSLQVEIGDMLSVINKTLDYRHRIVAAAASSIRNWKIKVLKLKAVFETLNKFNMDVTQKCLIAECWVPTVDLLVIQQSLRTGTERAGSLVQPVLNQMETFETPPTYFKLNKFTRGFQNIVDAYGIANYREVNPAPWTIITFPFLFAVMFGDAGHGIIMFLSALMFVLFEKKLEAAKIKDEIFNTFYGGRYVILLMGLFSIYTGIVYNDFYSKAIDIFGSKWRNPYNHTLLDQLEEYGRINDQEVELEMNPRYAFLHGGGPYPFGVDPVWNLAKNKLNFLNPMKMKLSVVIGIGQMAFGIILSLCNYIHKGSWVDFLFIFIPQVLFLSCIFIYLCVQIFLKWIFFWVIPDKWILGHTYPGSNCAPSLLIGLINMFMMKSLNDGFTEDWPGAPGSNNKTVDQCYQVQWYPHQSMIEKALLAVAVVSIPVMLLVKPFILRWKHNHGYHVDTGHGDEGHGEFSFADVMVYQAIHTIEFALGCISHTASYLRLWALSLAHAQLSEVLWDMVLAIALQMGGWAGAAAIHIIFWAFAVLSVSILVLMEGLSAFLHAIRLHWVEFQSKFYGGTGIQFEPFNFNQLIRIMEGFQE